MRLGGLADTFLLSRVRQQQYSETVARLTSTGDSRHDVRGWSLAIGAFAYMPRWDIDRLLAVLGQSLMSELGCLPHPIP